MLANDSTTIAVEVPIWLGEHDIAALEDKYRITIISKQPLDPAHPHAGHGPRLITGHIDFLQARNGAIHILDYKPDARTNKPIAQLTIYALALTRLVPGLKLFDIKCAWFNENCYNEFFPRLLLPRPVLPVLKGLTKKTNNSSSVTKADGWSGTEEGDLAGI
jgi:PD-(D/E)XK nuclease superfamily protein